MRVLGEVEAARLSGPVRRMLLGQCDGDWDRVTIDVDGGYTVWNSPAQAKAKASSQVSEPPPAAPRPSPPPPPTPKARESLPEARALNELIGSKAPQAACGVRVIQADRDEPGERFHWSGDPSRIDWEKVDLDQSVVRLRDQLIHGLPKQIPFKYLPEVLALHGVDFDAVSSAVRHPHRVEIRPETAQKKYPVLAFHRGDVTAIAGFRDPTQPAIIAVYVLSKLDGNGFQMQMLTGGGGKRAEKQGLPGSVRAMLRAIRSIGVEVNDDPTATTAEVKYKGQILGKVTVGSAPRSTVHSDYQRVIRKVHAIDRRVGASA